MRILFSLTYYTPYISGLTLYVKRLGEELAKKVEKYQVTVLTMQHEPHLPLVETINGVEVVRAKPLCRVSKGFLSFDWLVKSWQEVRKADVIILNLPQMEGIFPAFIAKIFKKKLIAIYHCEICLPKGLINSLLQLLLETANMISLQLADWVVTYTKDFAEHSRLLRSVPQKIKIVYPPVPVPKIDQDVLRRLQKKIKSSRREKIVGFAGRLAAEKGVEYLFGAVQRLQNYRDDTLLPKLSVKLVIAGPKKEVVGEEKYVAKISQLAEELGDQVVYLGPIPPEKIGAFYKLIDVLVLSSINSTEAFGMVQVEAMMMEVPVVATDLPGVRVPIKKTGMGKIVPSKDSGALAKAIIEVLNNRRQFMSKKNKARKEFALEKTVCFYEKLLATLAK